MTEKLTFEKYEFGGLKKILFDGNLIGITDEYFRMAVLSTPRGLAREQLSKTIGERKRLLENQGYKVVGVLDPNPTPKILREKSKTDFRKNVYNTFQ